MAKTVTFTDLLPPTDFTGSVVAGGTLSTGTTYYYVVQACFDSGTAFYLTKGRSQSSNQISASITTAGTQSVELSWTGSSGAGGYRIYRATSSGSYVQMINVVVRESVHCTGGICTITDTGYSIPGNTQYQNVAHGKLELAGSTSGDPFSIVDLYNSSSANGWGVVDMLDDDMYVVKSHIISDINGYWTDTEKVITLRDGITPGSNSTFTFGEKIGVTSRKGCRLIFKTPDLQNTNLPNLYAYKTTFDYIRFNPLVNYSGITPQTLSFSSGEVDYCLINKMRGFQPQSSANCTMSNTTVTEADVALGQGRATFTNITGMSNSRVFQTGDNIQITASEVTFIDNAGTLLIGNNFSVKYINSISASETDRIHSTGGGNGTTEDVFTYNLKVLDTTGTPVSGAAVQLSDTSGSIVFTDTTNSSGSISEKEVRLYSTSVVNYTGSSENLSPFTLIVTKDGYDEYREITAYSESIALEKTLTLYETGSLNTNLYGGTFYNSTIY